MAVAFDAIATANSHTTGTTVVTLSNANMTVGSGSNRALLCVVTWESVAAPTSISAKWDTAGTNQTMAQIGSTISNGNFRVALFGLLAPTSGAKNFTLSWTNTASCYLDLIAFTGVDQTSNAVAFPHFNSATATSTGPATVNITSATGNYTVASFVAGPAGDLTTLNQTVLYGPDIADSNCSGAANYAIGAASNTHSCTVSASVAWAVCGVDVLASGAGAVALPFNQYEYPKVWDIRQAPIDLSVQTNPNLFTNPFPFNQTDWTPARRIVRMPWPNELVDQVNNTRFKPLPSGVTFDTQSVGVITGSGATSFTDSLKMTVGTGLNRALIVELCLSGNPTGISVTWNGVSMTQIASITDAGLNTTTLLFGLRNPTSGTFALAGSWTGAASFIVSASAYINVNQASDAVAFQNSTTATGSVTPASVTVTSLAGNIVVAAYSVTLTTFRNISGIPLFSSNIGSFSGSANYALGSASVVMTSSEVSGQPWTAAGISLNASPPVLPPDNWDVPLRVPKAPFDLSVSLNPNLFKNPLPIGNVQGLTTSWGVADLPVPQQPYNQNLYSVTIIKPFNQTDWSNLVRVPDWLPQPQVGINPNLFTNPFPFNQNDWSVTERVPKAPFIPTDPLNINLFTNPIPFNQIDWSKSVNVPLSLPQPSPPLNINLFTNSYPFNQYDWSKSVRIPQAPIDLSFQFNQNLTNFFPFNQTDWSKPFNVPHAPFDLSVPLNPNIFTNPYPVLNIDTSRPARLAGLPQVDSPYNQTLYTVIISAVPFNQTYWPPAIGIPSAPVDFYNLVLYNITTLPFNQIDWSKPFTVPRAPPDQSVALNPNLFTNPIPFLATDRLPVFNVPLTLPQPSPPLNINLFTNPYPVLNIDSAIVPPRRATVLVDQTYNQSLYTVTVTAPFYVPEILFLKRPVSSPLPDPPLNINLFTNPIPIFNYDGSIPVRTRGFVDTSQPYNINLYGVVTVQVPFNQVDWSRPFVPRPAPTRDQALNINLFTNSFPFNQYDYPRQQPVPHAPFDLSVQTNPNLFKNPFPFNQYQYPTQRPVRLGPPHVPPYNQNLYTATLGTTSHIVKFIGNVGHFMIR